MSGKTDKVEVVTYHGWAFSRDFWKSLTDFISSDINVKLSNRGYFGGEETLCSFDKDSDLKILFLHSFGLHWCPDKVLKSADVIVIFNSFLDFHPSDEAKRKKSIKILKRMIDEFEKNPTSVLELFYTNCFYPHKSVYEFDSNFDFKKLLHDLNALNETSERVFNFSQKQKLIIVESDKDKIVIDSRKSNFEKAFKRSELFIQIEDASHAHLIENPSKSVSYLSKVLPIFREI